MRHSVAFEREIDTMVGVGAVDQSSFRLWLRAPGETDVDVTLLDGNGDHVAGPFRLVLDESRHPREHDATFAATFPDDLPDAPPLTAGRRYEVCVQRRADGSQLGTSRFETAPASEQATPDRFSIAVMSCHQPFNEEGELDEDAERLLAQLPDILETYAVKRVLLLGDQMYADKPKSFSLFGDYFAQVAPPGRAHILDCDSAEVRRIYQQRHRIFFNSPGFHRVQSRYPCLAAIDDHEIVDNFGSSPEHARERWSALRAGALQAAFDYQGLRAHDGCQRQTMDFGLRYGPFACYTLDLRTERVTAEDGEMTLYGQGQLDRLGDFMEAHADARTFALGLSVPLIHVPDWAAHLGITLTGEGTDIAERWSNPKARRSRGELVELLSRHQRAHPAQKLVLLGGDVHVGMLARLRWGEPPLEATQLTSSAVSNSQEGLEGFAAKHAAKLVTVRKLTFDEDPESTCEVDLCRSEARYADNPYGGLNVGILQFQRPSPGADYRIEAKLVGLDQNDQPRELVWTDV